MICGLSPRTLEKFRITGQGPRFVKLGRRRLYDPRDLSQWIAGNTVHSTAEVGR